LLGSKIDHIMVNNDTNQQMRSTTIHLQTVGIDTYIGPLALKQIKTPESKRQCQTTDNDGSDQNRPWKQSNRKFDN
jgi:hypothetical protein